jgi:phosphocarrier protein HPr
LKTETVVFHSADEIVDFVRTAQRYDFDVDIKYGHIVVDGKSLLGALAIGANRQVEICMHTGDSAV